MLEKLIILIIFALNNKRGGNYSPLFYFIN